MFFRVRIASNVLIIYSLMISDCMALQLKIHTNIINPNIKMKGSASIQMFPDLNSFVQSNRNVVWKRILYSAILMGSLQLSPMRTSALEQQYKLPPIDRSDKTRCELRSSSMGQANAARDKLYDLRECDLKGQVLCVILFPSSKE